MENEIRNYAIRNNNYYKIGDNGMVGEKEYGMLRNEILASYGGIRQYENIMYTSVAAILAFAIGSNYYILCMIPYIVIISVYFIVMSTKAGICRIAMYMVVFLEGGEFNWETRQLEYTWTNFNDEARFPWRTHSQYYLLSWTCTISTLLKLWNSNSTSTRLQILISIAVMLFSLLVMLMFDKKIFSYGKTKKEMKKHWLEVKKKMEAENRSTPIDE